MNNNKFSSMNQNDYCYKEYLTKNDESYIIIFSVLEIHFKK